MPINYEATKTLIRGLVQKMKSFRGNWNQNDPTADDYIKNRTHWKETTEVIIPETSIEFSSDEQCVEDPFILEIQEGSTYEVTWNGNVYQCVAYIAEGPNSPSIGNGTITSATGGNDEPFFITVFQGTTMVFAAEPGTHTVSILGEATTWHTLDKQYLPGKLVQSGNAVGSEVYNSPANVASGSYSHAEGSDTVASGFYSHAEGYHTSASGDNSHAEGNFTTASGTSSHAEGSNTVASGTFSHAEGSNTVAFGIFSHAEGNFTTASGTSSHAEGSNTVASGTFSHAEGNFTAAQRKSQHVQGEYNILDTEGTSVSYRGKYAHIVGNGTSNTARSNAHTLDWDGNAWFAGDVYVGSTSGTNKDDGSKKLVAAPTDVAAGDLLMYDGTNWVKLSKADLIAEIIAALPRAEEASF